MRTRSLPGLLVLLCVLPLAGGCLYRLPIPQGNVLNADQVEQLESGMTRSQVLYLLGTPMLPNGFDTDRWDYYYYDFFDIMAAKRDMPPAHRLTVFFKDEKVDRIVGGKTDAPGTPAAQTAASTPAPG
jgi:outer membrane protein assembly factor BamE